MQSRYYRSDLENTSGKVHGRNKQNAKKKRQTVMFYYSQGNKARFVGRAWGSERLQLLPNEILCFLSNQRQGAGLW